MARVSCKVSRHPPQSAAKDSDPFPEQVRDYPGRVQLALVRVGRGTVPTLLLKPPPSADELKDHRRGAIRGSLSSVSHAHRYVKRLKSFRKLEMRSDRQQRAVRDGWMEGAERLGEACKGVRLRCRGDRSQRRGTNPCYRLLSIIPSACLPACLPERGISTLSLSEANAPPRRSAPPARKLN